MTTPAESAEARERYLMDKVRALTKDLDAARALLREYDTAQLGVVGWSLWNDRRLAFLAPPADSPVPAEPLPGRYCYACKLILPEFWSFSVHAECMGKATKSDNAPRDVAEPSPDPVPFRISKLWEAVEELRAKVAALGTRLAKEFETRLSIETDVERLDQRVAALERERDAQSALTLNLSGSVTALEAMPWNAGGLRLLATATPTAGHVCRDHCLSKHCDCDKCGSPKATR